MLYYLGQQVPVSESWPGAWASSSVWTPTTSWGAWGVRQSLLQVLRTQSAQAKGRGLKHQVGSRVWVPEASLHSQSPSLERQGGCLANPGEVPTPASGCRKRSQEQWQLESGWHHTWHLGEFIILMSSWDGTCPPQGLSTEVTLHFLRRPHPACPRARFSAGSLHFPWSAMLRPPVQGCCVQEEACPGVAS